MRLRPLLTLMAVFSAAPIMARADLISDYNLIVTGNLTTTSEVEGRALIGGNLSGNATQYAFVNSSSYTGTNGLVVGGSVVGGGQGNVHVEGGNALIGGETNNQVSVNSPGTLTVNQTAALAITNQAASEISSLSHAYSLQSGIAPTISGNDVTFASNASGVVYFTVSALTISTLTNQNLQLDLVTPHASTVIINVSGTTVNMPGFNDNEFKNFGESNILFNFYQATSINLSKQFDGAILAPLATLTNNTQIDGSVFVQSFTQNGEVHLPNFTGARPPSAVPVPASVILLGLGLPGGLFASRFGKFFRSA